MTIFTCITIHTLIYGIYGLRYFDIYGIIDTVLQYYDILKIRYYDVYGLPDCCSTHKLSVLRVADYDLLITICG